MAKKFNDAKNSRKRNARRAFKPGNDKKKYVSDTSESQSSSTSFTYGTNSQNPKDYINAKVGGTNEFGWYNRCGNLIQDAGKINFYSVLGNPVNVADDYLDSDNGVVVNGAVETVPGIMVFDYVTTPGTASDSHSAANAATIQMYENMRSKLNKLNPNYACPDLGILMMAFDEIYCQYMNLVRLFGILNYWDANSKYSPQTLVEALYGIDADGFNEAISNKANLIFRFNYLLKFARKYVYYPEDFALTARHAWLCASIFRDHDTKKSQLYGFAKRSWYYFDEQTKDIGSMLIYDEYWNDGRTTIHTKTVTDYLDIFQQTIEAVRNSTSINDMVSDLRNAYDDKMTIAFADVDDGYTVEPSPRDDHALMQIENLITVPRWNEWGGKDVEQDPNVNLIVYRPRLSNSASKAAKFDAAVRSALHTYINLHNDDYGIEEVTESTRLKPLFATNTDLGEGFIELIPNAEIITDIFVYHTPELSPYRLPQIHAVYSSGTTPTDPWIEVQRMRYYNTFDWAPALYAVQTENSTGGAVVTETAMITEWDRYADCGNLNASNTFLEQLNRVCMLSLWNVPEHGSMR